VLVKEETLNKSLFYQPVQEVSKFMSPNIAKWYDEVKERTKETPANEKVSDSLNVDKKE
jgi:membrane protein required for colicin V production